MTDPRARDAYLRRVYGVSLEEWELVLAAQGGGCVGCGRRGVTRALHTEHSHRTQLLRMIACVACNGALAKAHDDPQTLRNLAAALEDPPFPRVLGRQQEILVKPRRRKRRR